jgi:hypothetical protein
MASRLLFHSVKYKITVHPFSDAAWSVPVGCETIKSQKMIGIDKTSYHS